MLEDVQAAYGYLPVAVLKHLSQRSGAPYALIYGTASYYAHLHLAAPASGGARDAARRPTDAGYLAGLASALSGGGPA
jgi:hypothetical protein